jgi:hypothetical protein
MPKWLGVVGLVASIALSSVAQARDFIWYDAAQQAIAIDLYAYGFGNFIEIDFNADHLTAGVIDQRFGDVTFFGVRRITQAEDYTVSLFGWSDPVLVDAEPTTELSTLVTMLGDNEFPAADAFHYFCPEWDTQAGKTVIYVRPVSDAGSVPVTPDMLANISLRLNEVEWQPFQSVPLLTAPIAVEVSTSPSVFNLEHDQGSVMAKIKLPSPYTAADVDLSTVELTINSSVAVEISGLQATKLSKKVALAGKDGSTLIAKFGRADLQPMLNPDAEVFAIGRFNDGTPFRGTATIKLINGPVY